MLVGTLRHEARCRGVGGPAQSLPRAGAPVLGLRRAYSDRRHAPRRLGHSSWGYLFKGSTLEDHGCRPASAAFGARAEATEKLGHSFRRLSTRARCAEAGAALRPSRFFRACGSDRRLRLAPATQEPRSARCETPEGETAQRQTSERKTNSHRTILHVFPSIPSERPTAIG